MSKAKKSASEPTVDELRAELQALEAEHEALRERRKALADEIERREVDERVADEIRAMSPSEYETFLRLAQSVQPDGIESAEASGTPGG